MVSANERGKIERELAETRPLFSDPLENPLFLAIDGRKSDVESEPSAVAFKGRRLSLILKSHTARSHLKEGF